MRMLSRLTAPKPEPLLVKRNAALGMRMGDLERMKCDGLPRQQHFYVPHVVNSSQLKMPNISSLSPSLVCLTFAAWKPYGNQLVQQVIHLSAEHVQFRVGLSFLIFDFIQTHNVEQNLGS